MLPGKVKSNLAPAPGWCSASSMPLPCACLHQGATGLPQTAGRWGRSHDVSVLPHLIQSRCSFLSLPPAGVCILLRLKAPGQLLEPPCQDCGERRSHPLSAYPSPMQSSSNGTSSRKPSHILAVRNGLSRLCPPRSIVRIPLEATCHVLLQSTGTFPYVLSPPEEIKSPEGEAPGWNPSSVVSLMCP